MHVLVVDDSAVVRMAVTEILKCHADVTVATAADPLLAIRRMQDKRPDVILLDLAMPHMDGLTFLRRIMSRDPIPVVICSALAERGTATAIRALEEGAVDLVTKPQLGVRDFIAESAMILVDTLRGASKVRMRPARQVAIAPKNTADAVLPPRVRPATTAGHSERIIAVGASTGGPEAIREFLQRMPADAPGIVIVQHMPEVFTAAFARRIDQLVGVEVKEAEEGDRVVSGRAFIAPGNRHMLVRRRGAEYVIELSDGPLVSRHKPSVDVLFRSVAQAAGAKAVGVIMTGMGDDGASGLLELRQSGASTLAQDEATCAVFGMPKEAIARGGAESVLPLHRLGDAALALTRAAASRSNTPNRVSTRISTRD
ncbi:MAG TPA: chemotaxis response regulator protein-glutamate methylesterase [Thermoanaerobaculia bacterium]|nr:chemotaxis response regulator protein-glutamate methylesterase [Thermoanaerobaculia bacterium]